jgi:hypothetical protein
MERLFAGSVTNPSRSLARAGAYLEIEALEVAKLGGTLKK